MKVKDLSFLFNEAVSYGAHKALRETSQLQDRLTKSEAFLLFGRTNIERWLLEGLIVPISEDGKISKRCIDRISLEQIGCSSNPKTYLPVANR